ncbi:MAG: hypothetical protein M1815_003953 [Lichina confinis]|nr:MAG: hypothetical protein M1815_003953 [Lichina confinis]
MNYVGCRRKGRSEEHCRHQTTITVDDEIFRAQTRTDPPEPEVSVIQYHRAEPPETRNPRAEGEFQSQMLSLSELVQSTGRIVERYFLRPERMGEKKVTGVFRGGALPRVPRFRPY